MALTATATDQFVQDIIQNLGLRDPLFLKQSFNRHNLYYEIRDKPGRKDKLVAEMFDWIQTKHMGHSGVVYCLARAKCEETAQALRERGLKAKHYHALMTKDDKRRVQEEWQQGRYDIIVATVSS